MEKSKIAIDLLDSGFNCAQAVLAAFGPELGLEKEQCLKVATAFGSGMAKQQSVCGALTGAYMALGLKYGKYLESDEEGKARTYQLVQKFNAKFKESGMEVHCKDILGFDMNTEEGKREMEKKEYRVKCENAIKHAVEILEEMI